MVQRTARFVSFLAVALGAGAAVAPSVQAQTPAPAPASSAAPGAAPSASAPSPVAAGGPTGPDAYVVGPITEAKPPPGGLIGLPITARVRRGAAAPKAPTAAQLKAMRLLREEARRYSSETKAFQQALTTVVKHHYKEKRRRLVSGLDREIKIEEKNLNGARDRAIARLEDFIKRYSGKDADPKATPDAMFRLAALYEERAKVNFDSDLTKELKTTIGIYRRIIEQFPTYDRIAAVHYYLGHSYYDAGRLNEAQQAWRSLVCSERYQVVSDPSNPTSINVQPLVQDHDQQFWGTWYGKNPLPFDRQGRLAAAGGVSRKAIVDPATAPPEEELLFKDPYPDTCVALKQPLEPGEDPRYVAEVWWQLGNYHFDQIGDGGPFAHNRAVSAYDHSLQFTKPPLYGVAMYKQAWTFYKQQRYQTAVEWFVKLLHYTDEQERLTGDTGADFRSEAYTYIAGSLTYVDFEGPPAGHPNIPRSDVFDTEMDPLRAEQKMAIAIDRVQDPKLIPQDKPWSPNIYKQLAQEFAEINQNHNAIKVLELTLARWPNDRDAPSLQNRVADYYEKLMKQATGSEAREEYAQKALDARTQLARYVATPEQPTTPWLEANKDDPEAVAQAEQLVKTGLKRAAADHTNYARDLFNRAVDRTDAAAQKDLLRRSIAEYRKAEKGWAAYLAQDRNALDAYESRFWLADARYEIVHLQTVLGTSPTPREVRRAVTAARAVRDSNEDDKYLQQAAYNVVSLYASLLNDQHRLAQETGGKEGIVERKEVEVVGEGAKSRVIAKPVPKLVLAAVRARDDYNYSVPLDADPEKNGLLYAYQSADYFFLYGDFKTAERRFGAIKKRYCGKNEWGFKSWKRLVDMSVLSGDLEGSRKLVNAKPCYFDDESKRRWEALKNPISQGLAFEDARRLFEEAKTMKDGPQRDEKWRKAAAAYRVALDQGPDRPEAPEAAINGAYAYQQVGEFDKAIEMYQLFISKYGDNDKLVKLRDGDAAAKPPKKPNKAEYETRVKYLQQAYNALADAYMKFFNFPKAAETFDEISSIDHFPKSDRRDAAKRAVALFGSLGVFSEMRSVRGRYETLGADAEELAEIDFTAARSQLGGWDEGSPDTGANKTARIRAQSAFDLYYRKNQRNPAAAKFVVRAAYHAARLRRAAGLPLATTWWKNTIKAFDAYAKRAPRKKGPGGKQVSAALGSYEAALAAEADYTLVDQELKRKFDFDTGHHRYKGDVVRVIKAYRADLKVGQKYDKELEAMHARYGTKSSPTTARWGAIITARQGSIYDSMRTGLYNARPPALKLFTTKEERLLSVLERSPDENQRVQADVYRTNRRLKWRKTRDRELNNADQEMIRLYAEATLIARTANVSSPDTTRALRRLAFFTELLGEAKMKAYTAPLKELKYSPGMFLRSRPGVVKKPEATGIVGPLPVGQ